MAPTTLNLIKVFRHHSLNKAAAVNANLTTLRDYIKDGDDGTYGWFFDKHCNDASFSRHEALLYFRALLGTRCLHDSDLGMALIRSFLPSEAAARLIFNRDFLNPILSPVQSKQGFTVYQIIQPRALDYLLAFLDNPKALERLLAIEGKPRGWMLQEGGLHGWFYTPDSKLRKQKKHTHLQEKIFRLLVLIIIDLEDSDQETYTDYLAMLQFAWEPKYGSKKPSRDMEVFAKKLFKDPHISFQPQTKELSPLLPNIRAPRRRRLDLDEDYDQADGPSHPIPLATRRTQHRAARSVPKTPQQAARHSPPLSTATPGPGSPSPLPTSTGATPQNRALELGAGSSPKTPAPGGSHAKTPRFRVLSTAAKKFSSIFRSGKRRRMSSALSDKASDDGSDAESSINNAWNDAQSPGFNDGFTDTPYREENEPSDTSIMNADDSSSSFYQDNPLLIGPGIEKKMLFASSSSSKDDEEEVEEEEGFQQPERQSQRLLALAALRESQDDQEVNDTPIIHPGPREQRQADSLKVMGSVCKLAAVGSPRTKETMKSILLSQLPTNRASLQLKETGYGSKVRERVIENKRKQNERIRRVAQKRGKEPVLVPETCGRQFSAPLTNVNANARLRAQYQTHLIKGKDLEKPRRACHIKKEKIDELVKWIVENFQFRPGKTRNVRFKGDGVTLKNLPVYMRYGSLHSLFRSYRESTPKHLWVGDKAFRDVLYATTLKGTYNQGLSYYYVEFQDMTKLVLQMLKRLRDILDSKAIIQRMKTPEEREAWQKKRTGIKEWVTKTEVNTELSREYLTHQFYADIRKETEDGWTCATHALGEDHNLNLSFDPESALSVALNNHVLIIYAVNLVLDALDAQEDLQEDLHDEFVSMFDLANLSGILMLHYTKHLMRGWWQDTTVNELKKLMFFLDLAKVLIMDHKNKLVPRSKDEAMSAYFSKHGMSVLGCMVLWKGKKGNIRGIFARFIDIIMENTTSQEARDLMPGIEAILQELVQEDFVEVAGPTKAVAICSDNALVAASHWAFIHALNNASTPLANAAAVDDLSISQQSSVTSSDESATSGMGEEVCHGTGNTSGSNSMAAGGTDADDLSDEAYAELIKQKIDEFAEEMRETFANRIKNWNNVEPAIVKWLTWEAQRGKTQLDTHFAYLNKQLAAACLEGEIDYLDPKSVFDALKYKGGSRATTTILLKELDRAEGLFKECNKAMHDRTGINSVHDMTFGDDGVRNRFFSNLSTGQWEPIPKGDWPIYDKTDPVGKISDRHFNSEDPIFFPFKDTIPADTLEKEEKAPLDDKFFSTRVYHSLMKHSAGMAVGEDARSPEEQKELAEEEALEDRRRRAKDIAWVLEHHGEVIEAIAGNISDLEIHWAKKKQRRDFQMSDEVKKELLEMFEKGQGHSNKALRYTAERAVSELHGGLLKARWDQRLIADVTRVKRFFSTKHQAAEKDADRNRKAANESRELKHERGKQLLEDNKLCEEKLSELVGAGDAGFQNATMDHFGKLAPPLLQAFIKARVLKDACSRELGKMPKKGSMKEAKDGSKNKAGQLYLIRWAYDLRQAPISAKLEDTPLLEVTDDDLLELAIQGDEQEELTAYDDIIATQNAENESEIQEVFSDDDSSSSSSSSDDDDDDDADDAGGAHRDDDEEVSDSNNSD